MKPFIKISFVAVALLSQIQPSTCLADDVASYFASMSSLLRQTIEKQFGTGADSNSLVALLSVGISAEPVSRPVNPITEQNLYPYLNMRMFAGTNNAEVNTADLGATDGVATQYLRFSSDAKIPGLSPDDQKRLNEIALRQSSVSDAYFTATNLLFTRKNELAQKRTDGKISLQDFFTQLAGIQQNYNLNPSVKEYTDLVQEAFNIETRAPGFIWRLRQQRMTIASASGFPVISYPDYNDWAKEDGWTSFKATRKSVDEETSKSGTNASANVSLWGFIPLGSGSFANSADLQSKLTKASTISFDVKRVLLGRFWLDESAFSDSTFESRSGAPPLMSTGVVNAAGRYGEEDRQPGVIKHEYSLPLIPSEIILVRNLTIVFDSEAAAKEFKSGTVGGNAGFSLFGFRIGGSASHSWESTSNKLDQSGNSITATGMNILGFVCHKSSCFPFAKNAQALIPMRLRVCCLGALLLTTFVSSGETLKTETPLIRDERISYLSSPIQVVDDLRTGGDFVSRDTELIDAIEHLDHQNQHSVVGITRAARIQLLLSTLRSSKRISINLEGAERRKFDSAVTLLGVDDDLTNLKEGKRSRQSIRTRELLAFLFDDQATLPSPKSADSDNNVFKSVIRRRSELNAQGIQAAYDSVMPVLLLSFNNFCTTAAANIPRVDNGLVMGAFELVPPRPTWSNEDGWTKIQHPSSLRPELTISGEFKKVRIESTSPYKELMTFLALCVKEQGVVVKINSPSGLESLKIQRDKAQDLLELLRSVPSSLYLGRKFTIQGGAGDVERPIDILVRTSGTFAFGLEYER